LKDDSAATTNSKTTEDPTPTSEEKKKSEPLEKTLPGAESPSSRKQEPETKKLKSTHETPADTDDEWEKIDEASVPRPATVEDADDDEGKK
jgi:hypothetical protein